MFASRQSGKLKPVLSCAYSLLPRIITVKSCIEVLKQSRLRVTTSDMCISHWISSLNDLKGHGTPYRDRLSRCDRFLAVSVRIGQAKRAHADFTSSRAGAMLLMKMFCTSHVYVLTATGGIPSNFANGWMFRLARGRLVLLPHKLT